jgi:hypothetical protein
MFYSKFSVLINISKNKNQADAADADTMLSLSPFRKFSLSIMQKFIATGCCRMPKQPHGGHKQRHNLQLERYSNLAAGTRCSWLTESEISLFSHSLALSLSTEWIRR